MTLPGEAPDVVPLRAVGRIPVGTDCLLEMVLDLDRYVAIEPRLDSAVWLTTGPAVGAVLEVVANVPYGIPALQVVFGQPRGQVTLTAWDPPTRVVVTFSSASFVGEMLLTMDPIGQDESVLAFDGWVRANMPFGRMTTRMLRPVLARRATESIHRAVRRAAVASLARQPTRASSADLD